MKNTQPRLTAEQRNDCAHCQTNCEQRGQTKTRSLPLMTEPTALCSLRQAERNPYAHHKDCTIPQLAGGAGQQIMTAEPFKSCHLQNRKDVALISRGWKRGSSERSKVLSSITSQK